MRHRPGKPQEMRWYQECVQHRAGCADKAGEIIVRGMERSSSRILVGSDVKVASVPERMAPAGYWSFLKEVIGR